MNKIEILAPAGGMDSLYAAVNSGADAVYIGAESFSARAFAKNFSQEELRQAVEHCHGRGVLVYLTMNTLLTDKNLKEALLFAQKACLLPIDAFIVQDVGFGALLRRCAPSVALHASTQMSVHTLAGAQLLYGQGFTRIVLSRELSKTETEHIVKNCPAEFEVFVHGALCMSVSGQCYLSSFLGGRSGNHGMCAQPCRLPFAVKGGTGHDLSLKDLSILTKLKELEKMGVASAKIEGRMKRPEYVACAVQAARQYREHESADPSLTENLKNIFSRSGFTSGYYSGKLGKSMFGTRQKENVTAATSKLLSAVRNSYSKELNGVYVQADFILNQKGPCSLTATDKEKRSITVYGGPGEFAIKTPLTNEKATQQLQKTGGTPFCVSHVNTEIEPGTTISASQLNLLRRTALEKLLEKRSRHTAIPFSLPDELFTQNGMPKLDIAQDNFQKSISLEKNSSYKLPKAFNLGSNKAPSQCSVSLSKTVEINKGAARSSKDASLKTPSFHAVFYHTDISHVFKECKRVFVPLFSKDREITRLQQEGFKLGVHLPRGMFSQENKIKQRLNQVFSLGVAHAMASNLGGIPLINSAGLTLHGGFGLNLSNTYSLAFMKSLNMQSAELSIELSARQADALPSVLPKGVIIYGHIPLMLTRNCPGKNGSKPCGSCNKLAHITDRKNISFPLICDGTCTQLLNSVPLYMGDKQNELSSADFFTLYLTTENQSLQNEVFLSIKNKSSFPYAFTRGLYEKGVQKK